MASNDGDCEVWYRMEAIYTILAVISALPPLMTLTLKLMYDGVEITHPVFALIFQEVIVVMTCVVINIASIVGRLTLGYLGGVFMVVNSLAVSYSIMFHQTTWLAITSLR